MPQSSTNEDAKAFLNSTLNVSNYNSNTNDSRNANTANKSSRNNVQQTVIHHHQTINAAKGMPQSALQTSQTSQSYHKKQNSIKTPTKVGAIQ